MQTEISKAKILIVDDEPGNVLLLQRVLMNAGYTQISSASDGKVALEKCALEQPDIILLDLMMPILDGFGVLEALTPHLEQVYLPVLVLTADSSHETKRRALMVGAKDFLTKPFSNTEVLVRVKNLLETRMLTLELAEQNRDLEERVAQRTTDLLESNRQLEIYNQQLKASQRAAAEAQIEVLNRLAQAAELRDDDTGQHTYRVAHMAARLATQMGLEAESIELIHRAAPLHDVGKIGISDTILLKPSRLTSEEFEIMKTHTAIGGALLAGGQSPFIRTAEKIALTHHERFDGKGYPHGLSGEEIPLEGRILSVVDVFDALTHERPYKQAWPVEQALGEIEKNSGTQFDPAVVQAFVRLQSS